MGDEKGNGMGEGGGKRRGGGGGGGGFWGECEEDCGGGSSSVYSSRPLSRGVMRTHFLRYSSYFGQIINSVHKRQAVYIIYIVKLKTL